MSKTLVITSESEFREKGGIPTEVDLNWTEGKVIQSTQLELDTLKKSMSVDATDTSKLANEFIQANTRAEQAEKQDAVDALVEKLGTNILKNPTVIATGAAAAAGITTMVTHLDTQIEKSTSMKVGFMDSIRDWLKEAASESEGFMQSIWMMLYKMIGGKESGEEQKKQEGSNPQKPETPKSIIDTSNLRYKAAYTGLVILHQDFSQKITKIKEKDTNKNAIIQVFSEKSLTDLPYQKAQHLYQQYKSNPNVAIKTDIGITNTNIAPEHIVAALGMIIDDGLSTTKFFTKNISGNSQKKVGEVLTDLHHEFAIVKDIDKLTISSLSDMNIGAIFGNIASIYTIDKTGGFTKGFTNPDTQAKATDMGITRTILSEIISSDIDINKTPVGEIDNKGLSPEAKVFLKKLYTFWKESKPRLIQHFSFGKQAEYSAYYDSAIIRPISLMKLYLASSGHTNLHEFSGPRKIGIYAIIRESFFDGNDANNTKGAELFNKSILQLVEELIRNGPESISKMIDKDTQEIMLPLLARAGSGVFNHSFGIAYDAWQSLPDHWKLTTGVGIIAGLGILWRLGPLKIFGVGVLTGVGSTFFAAAASSIYSGLSSENQKIYPQEKIHEGLENWVKKIFG